MSEGTQPIADSSFDGEMTRREFVTKVSKVAGGAAAVQMLAAMGVFAESGGNPAFAASPRLTTPRKLVIIGAGIAGMSVAYEMAAAGYQVVVLEAAAKAGGRNKTARTGDTITEVNSSGQTVTQTCTFDNDPSLYMNLGPGRIPYHHRALLGYCKKFGVALEPFLANNRASYHYNPSALGAKPVRQRQTYTDTRGYIADLLVRSVNRGALDVDLSSSDKSKLIAMLRQFGDLNGSGKYVGSTRGGFSNQPNQGNGGAIINTPLPLSGYLNSVEWWREWDEDFNHQQSLMQPVGGMDKIVQAFVARMGQYIKYNAVVTSINNTATGVSVTYTQNGQTLTETGDYAVCTIPAGVLSSIPNNFKATTNTAIKGIQYQKSVKIGFQSTRWWEDENFVYGGITWCESPLTQMWYPSSGFHSAQGVLVAAYTWDSASDAYFQNMTPATRISTAANLANSIHSGFSTRASKGLSMAWGAMPYQRGSWATDGTANPAALQVPDGRVYFAGEHLSGMPSWQEGAIVSGQRVMTQIVARG